MPTDTNGNTKINEPEKQFYEIYNKIYLGNLTIVHIKSTMEPKLYDNDNKMIIDIPEGYLEYDKKKYIRKI
jgi:hypothetical protein